MNKTEIKKISDTLKGLILQARLIGDDLTTFEDDMKGKFSKVKEVNEKKGRDEALKLIPFIREMGYNHSLKIMDAESVNSKIMTVFSLAEGLGIELDLEDDDYDFIESISFKSWLHTVVIDGKLEISKESKFDKVVVDASLTHNFEPEETTLDKILNLGVNVES